MNVAVSLHCHSHGQPKTQRSAHPTRLEARRRINSPAVGRSIGGICSCCKSNGVNLFAKHHFSQIPQESRIMVAGENVQALEGKCRSDGLSTCSVWTKCRSSSIPERRGESEDLPQCAAHRSAGKERMQELPRLLSSSYSVAA